MIEARVEAAGIETDHTCFLVRDALGSVECEQLIERATGLGFGLTGADYPAGYRNNDRRLLDDPALARTLFDRLRPWLPEELLVDGDEWRLTGLNDRFRFCRYRGGQSFVVHRDGAFAPSADVRSYLTCMMYLDDATAITGGRTRFYADRTPESRELGAVVPRAGTLIVFDHALWHDGEAVTRGTKHVLRTDVLYSRERHDSKPFSGHTGYVWSTLALRDGALATGSRDRTIRIWELDGSPRSVLEGHAASVTCLAEPRAGEVWSGSRDRTVRCWITGESRVLGTHEGTVLALATLADGSVAATDATGTVTIRSIEGETISAWRAHTGWAWGLAALDDGTMVSGGDDGLLAVWDAGGRCVRSAGVGGAIRAVATANRRIVAGLASGRIVEFDAALRERRRWQGHAGAVLALHIDGNGIVSGGEDERVRVWDETRVVAEHPHSDFVRAVTRLRDGRLVSGSYDGNIRVWPEPHPH